MLPVQSSGKLEMERGMVKPMMRGEQQDSRYALFPAPPLVPLWSDPLGCVLRAFLHFSLCFRSQDGAEKAESTLPASIEFRDNCKCSSPQFTSIDHCRFSAQ